MYTQNLNREYFEECGVRMVKLSGPCVFSGKQYEVIVPEQHLQRYEGGELAQRAFPLLSPDQREFLISGVSPEGWAQTFGGEE